MKIIYVHGTFIPSTYANSIHVMKMCDALIELGHDVVLIVPSFNFSPIRNIDIEQYSLRNKFRIMQIYRMRNLFGSIFYGIQSAIKAVKSNPDIIYTRAMSTAVFLKFNKIPFIYEIHQTPNTRIRKYIYKLISKSKACVKLVTISNILKNILTQTYPTPNSKILVAPDAADLRDFEFASSTWPKEIYNTEEGKISCLYTGTLALGRGMEQIIDVANNHQEINFIFIGNINNAYLQQIKPNIPINVKLVGRVPYKDIPRIMKCADILLLPQQVDAKILDRHGTSIGMYNSPMKAFEYMAAGGAIVCSDIPCLREIFIEEDTAIFVSPPDNSLAWSKAIGRLIKSKELRKKLSANANKFAIEHTWEKRAESILLKLI